MTNLFEFFERIHREQWSGQVTLISTQGRCIVRCAKGLLIFAHKAIDRTLLRWERLDWLTIPEIESAEQQAWSTVIGHLLKANSHDAKRLQKLLLTERRETFLRTFFWSNVEVREHSHPAALEPFAALSFYTPLDMGELIREARQRVKDWPSMRIQMGSSKKVFMSSVPAQNIPALIQHSLNSEGSSTTDKPSVFTLDELELLQHCDGHHSLNDLIQMLPQGEFLIIQMIIELQKRGALKAKEDLFQDGSAIRTLSLSVTDAFNSVILTVTSIAGLTCIGFVLSFRVPSSCETRSLQQALELYRSSTHHYPLTLNDLPRSMSIHESAFSYSLLNPVNYKLECRH